MQTTSKRETVIKSGEERGNHSTTPMAAMSPTATSEVTTDPPPRQVSPLEASINFLKTNRLLGLAAAQRRQEQEERERRRRSLEEDDDDRMAGGILDDRTKGEEQKRILLNFMSLETGLIGAIVFMLSTSSVYYEVSFSYSTCFRRLLHVLAHGMHKQSKKREERHIMRRYPN